MAKHPIEHKDELLHQVIDNAPIVLWSVDTEGVFTLSEGKGMTGLGLKPGGLVGRSVFDVYKDEPQVVSEVKRALAGESFFSTVKVGELYFDTRYKPLRDADGRVSGVLGVSTDITEIQTAKDELERQVRYLRSLRTIDIMITGSLDILQILNVFLEEVASRLQADAVDVLLLNSHTKVLEYAAGSGFKTQAIAQTDLRLGDGYAGRAALERRPLMITDLTQTEEGGEPPGILIKEGFKAYFGVPLIAKGGVKGVLEIYFHDPFAPDMEWIERLETLSGLAAIAIDNSTMFIDLQRSRDELVLAYDSTIEGWANALDLRDKETEGHARRVTRMTTRIARQMGMTEEELVHVRRGALLHDIGKMSVPDSVLFKKGPLTDKERKQMFQHPTFAYKLLYPIKYLRPALDIPYCHHEKWDGSGYPRGLNGEQIPLAARIFAVVDTWDALLTPRRYHEAWSPEKVRDHIRSLSGKHFDPEIVKVFLSMVQHESATGKTG